MYEPPLITLLYTKTVLPLSDGNPDCYSHDNRCSSRVQIWCWPVHEQAEWVLPPIAVRLFLYSVERSELLGYPFLSMAWGKLHDLYKPPLYKNPQNSMVHIQVAGVFDVFTKRKSFPKEKSTGMIWMSETVTKHCKPWRVWGCHRMSLDSKSWMCCSNSVAAANLLLVNCFDSWICAQYDRESYKQWINTHTHTKKPSLWQFEKLRLDCILVFLSRHSGLFHPLTQLVSGSFVMTKLWNSLFYLIVHKFLLYYFNGIRADLY